MSWRYIGITDVQNGKWATATSASCMDRVRPPQPNALTPGSTTFYQFPPPISWIESPVADIAVDVRWRLSAQPTVSRLTYWRRAPRLPERCWIAGTMPFRDLVNAAQRILERQFGLPRAVADPYALRLVWTLTGGPSTAERFGLSDIPGLRQRPEEGRD